MFGSFFFLAAPFPEAAAAFSAAIEALAAATAAVCDRISDESHLATEDVGATRNCDCNCNRVFGSNNIPLVVLVVAIVRLFAARLD